MARKVAYANKKLEIWGFTRQPSQLLQAIAQEYQTVLQSQRNRFAERWRRAVLGWTSDGGSLLGHLQSLILETSMKVLSEEGAKAVEEEVLDVSTTVLHIIHETEATLRSGPQATNAS